MSIYSLLKSQADYEKPWADLRVEGVEVDGDIINKGIRLGPFSFCSVYGDVNVATLQSFAAANTYYPLLTTNVGLTTGASSEFTSANLTTSPTLTYTGVDDILAQVTVSYRGLDTGGTQLNNIAVVLNGTPIPESANNWQWTSISTFTDFTQVVSPVPLSTGDVLSLSIKCNLAASAANIYGLKFNVVSL